MQRLALSLALISASLSACIAATALPSRAIAFEAETGTVTGGSTQFQDLDEKPLPAPLTSPHLDADGANLQTAPGTGLQTTPGTGLQLTPGLSLQITGGSGPDIPGLQSGLQMAPMMDRSNPANDRTLIPAP
jgi:hypothetical protein